MKSEYIFLFEMMSWMSDGNVIIITGLINVSQLSSMFLQSYINQSVQMLMFEYRKTFR